MTLGDRTYHSTLEAQDALWLHQMQRDGEINALEEQVRFRIYVEGKHVTDSIVDFRFRCGGVLVWYETKGFPTPEYKLKRRLIEILIPDGEAYLVNAKELMEFMRGRTRKE